MKDYSQMKTDAERFEALNDMHYSQWDIVAEWEKEAKDEHYKQIFHNTARSMHHTEEYFNGEL